MQQPKDNTAAWFAPRVKACKKKKNPKPRQVQQNKYAGFRFKHILTTFGRIQKSASEPNKCISAAERTAWVCSIPNQLVPKGPGNVITNNSEHRRTQAPTQTLSRCSYESGTGHFLWVTFRQAALEEQTNLVLIPL